MSRLNKECMKLKHNRANNPIKTLAKNLNRYLPKGDM